MQNTLLDCYVLIVVTLRLVYGDKKSQGKVILVNIAYFQLS